MKPITIVTVFVLGFFAVVCNANAGNSPIEFRGYMEFDGEQLFSLKSTHGGGSAWVHLGQRFCKGKLVDYDPLDKSVTFSSSEGTFTVKMLETKGVGNLIENYVPSSQVGSSNVNHSAIARRGSIPRVLTTPIYKERVITKYEDKLIDYKNPSKRITSSSPRGTFEANTLDSDEGYEESTGNYEALNLLGLDSVNRRTVIRRGSIPRVPTSRTREEKEALRSVLNGRI